MTELNWIVLEQRVKSGRFDAETDAKMSELTSFCVRSNAVKLKLFRPPQTVHGNIVEGTKCSEVAAYIRTSAGPAVLVLTLLADALIGKMEATKPPTSARAATLGSGTEWTVRVLAFSAT
ncbi:MAG: hypothetical protein ACXW32_11770 [Limisphaerales bacterium]